MQIIENATEIKLILNKGHRRTIDFPNRILQQINHHESAEAKNDFKLKMKLFFI